MKDSGVQWIGQVPKHWEVCKIKNIGLFYSGLVNKRGDDFNVEETDKFAYYIPFTNIFNNVEIDVTQLRKVNVNPVEAQNEAKENDIFFLMSSEDTEGIGKTAVLRELTAEYKPLYLNSFCKGLRITSNEVDAIFLNYFMSSDAGNTYCRLQANGFIRINLRLTKLVDCPVLLPPLSEQRAISDWLDAKCADIDAAIELQQRMIDKLKAYKTAVIHQAVTKGLDKNANLKDSGVQWIGEIPKHWDVCQIKQVCRIFGRIGYRGYTQDDLVDTGEGAITLSPSNMQNGKMNFNKCNYLTWKKYYESPEIMINDGDILFVKTGSTYGKTSIVENLPMEATINPQIVVLKEIKMNNYFLYYLLLTEIVQGQVSCSVGGSTIPTLSQESISNYVIPLPPLSEQRAIADWLDAKCADIDATIALKEQKQEKLKAYKKTIIFEYVTGKKQVANINK